MLILEILKSAVLGIIEGITEWLPVSSTGHIILFDEFIPLNASAAFKDISSLLLLSKVKDALAEAGYAVGNIDATIVAQAPKMAPHIPEMKQKIAATLGCSEDVVNVKATTEEKLGFTGSEEGIAAHAVCLLYAV